MLEPRLPVLGDLNFIEENVFHAIARRLELAPEANERVEADELEQRMVERGVENVRRGDAASEEVVNGLEEKRGLADLSRAAEKQGAACGRVVQPGGNLAERGPL